MLPQRPEGGRKAVAAHIPRRPWHRLRQSCRAATQVSFFSAISATAALSSPTLESSHCYGIPRFLVHRCVAEVPRRHCATNPLFSGARLLFNVKIVDRKMTRGAWRMLAMPALLVLVSFLCVCSVDAQATPCKQPGQPDCDSHATCYHQNGRGYFCACDNSYTGNGFSCKYSTWRTILYILASVVGFVLIFYLCLSLLGRGPNQAQASSSPMGPMGGTAYGYPPPPAMQSSANPAMYAYPPQTGYPPQPGYPVNGFPPQIGTLQSNSKVPGPSGTV